MQLLNQSGDTAFFGEDGAGYGTTRDKPQNIVDFGDVMSYIKAGYGRIFGNGLLKQVFMLLYLGNKTKISSNYGLTKFLT